MQLTDGIILVDITSVSIKTECKSDDNMQTHTHAREKEQQSGLASRWVCCFALKCKVK